MHSNLHQELYRAEAADRVRRAHRAVLPLRRHHPPPIRGRAAYAAARLAHRLDSESARKAVA
jgi:benzoyl-CoA reductase/2-hydroxyglutaryl-CoA dehydratase subunit BcrC/BadD/HgdB